VQREHRRTMTFTLIDETIATVDFNALVGETLAIVYCDNRVVSLKP
jgi:hypothetical protein